MSTYDGQRFYDTPCFRGMAATVCLMESGSRLRDSKPAHAIALAVLAAALSSDCSRWRLPRRFAAVNTRLDYLIGREETRHRDVLAEMVEGRAAAVRHLSERIDQVRADLAELAHVTGVAEALSHGPALPPVTPRDGN